MASEPTIDEFGYVDNWPQDEEAERIGGNIAATSAFRHNSGYSQEKTAHIIIARQAHALKAIASAVSGISNRNIEGVLADLKTQREAREAAEASLRLCKRSDEAFSKAAGKEVADLRARLNEALLWIDDACKAFSDMTPDAPVWCATGELADRADKIQGE